MLEVFHFLTCVFDLGLWLSLYQAVMCVLFCTYVMIHFYVTLMVDNIVCQL